jgi:hypothetical protein
LFFVFSFISPFVLCFPSVSNFYFTSQYHQFPLSHTAAAATTTPAAATTSSSHHHPQQQQSPPQQQQPQ